MSSLPATAVSSLAKKRSYECYSDQTIMGRQKSYSTSFHEYTATVTDFEGDMASLIAKKNYIFNGEVRAKNLTNEKAFIKKANKYLIVQGAEWALAIAPQKKRASLYSTDPDINEVPMFCLSR